jgi:hypothetical protein
MERNYLIGQSQTTKKQLNSTANIMLNIWYWKIFLQVKKEILDITLHRQEA